MAASFRIFVVLACLASCGSSGRAPQISQELGPACTATFDVLMDSAETVPLPGLGTQPAWESSDQFFATGVGVGDFNGDGLPDLVVSNGNDMASEPISIWFGGRSTLPTSADRIGGSNVAHGKLSVGDINLDGEDDVLVSITGTYPYYHGVGGVAAYFIRDGLLPERPSWQSDGSFVSFSNALFDIDQDGDLDVVAACGAWGLEGDTSRIFMNSNGTLDTAPSWLGPNALSEGVAFGDIDQDGWIDIVFANVGSPHMGFKNKEGHFDPEPDWLAGGVEEFAGNSVAVGDVDGDGRPDAVFSQQRSTSGYSGNLLLYRGAGPFLETEPAWTSANTNALMSAVSFQDVDGDGDLDLVAGAWWGSVWIYENRGGTLSPQPVWTSDTTSVIEEFAWWDSSGAASEEIVWRLPGDGNRRLFALPDQNAFVRQVLSDCKPIRYTASKGWVSVPVAPTALLEVTAVRPVAPALFVTNWDEGIGNYLFVRK